MSRHRALLLGLAPVLGLLSGVALGAMDGDRQEAHVGDIFVANISANTVTRYDGATGAYRGAFVEAGAGGLAGPTGLAFGPDGHLYVSSSRSDRVLRYDGDSGAFLDVFVADSSLETPFSLVFGPDGDLYISSGTGNRVLRYDGRTGEPAGIAAGDEELRQPIGLRFGPDGMLYVVNSGNRNVLRFDPQTGRSTGVFASEGLRFPSDLVFGPDGSLYVSSASGGEVLRFDGRTGAPGGVAARLPEGAAPVGLDFTLDGRLVIGDFAGSRLFLAAPDGTSPPELVATEGLAKPENIVVRPPGRARQGPGAGGGRAATRRR